MKKVIKASAGTGKTYTLSLEYIADLLRGTDFEEILVMTFTRKATAEIRNRVLEHLENIIYNDDIELIKNLKDLDPDISFNKDILEKQYKKILKNRDKIRIYTIDGFLNSIFKKAIAPVLNIYSYEMIDSNTNREILEKIFEKILDNHKYFEQMKEFLETSRERDIDKYIDLIEKLIYNRWKFLMIDYKERKNLEVEDSFKMLEEMIFNFKEILKAKGKTDILPAIKKAFKDYFVLESIEEKEKYIQENQKSFLKNYFWNGNKVKGKKVKSMVNELKESYEIFQKNIISEVYNQEIIPYEKDVFDFVGMIFKIYDEMKLKEMKFTHTDISTYVFKYMFNGDLNLIKDGKLTDYFYDLLGGNIKSIFVDEFQDTSILQWKILKSIIDSSQNSIIVGDSKQSIYGWRGGEKKLFENIDRIIDAPTKTLDTSYRSQQEIITFVNRFFNDIDPNWEYEDVKYLSAKDDGFVKTFFGGKNGDLDVKKEIATTIKNNIKNYKNTAIIARKNKHLTEISQELEKLGIPYITESNDSIIDHKAVFPLYRLLRYINYNDYFDLLSFLRSDLVFIPESSLKYLLKNKEEIQNYLNFPNSKPNDILKDLRAILSFVKKMKGYKYSELANHLIEDFGILEKFNSASDYKNIYYFFEKMKSFTSLPEFIEFIKMNRDSEEMKQRALEEVDAVKLLTIHKSKGLEFDTQFFYWNLSSRKGHGHSLEFYIDFDENFENITDYLMVNSKWGKYLELLELDFYNKDEEKSRMEELNNIYVAITRPKSNLYLCLDTTNKKVDSFDKVGPSDTKYYMYKKAILNSAGSEIESMMDLTENKHFLGELREREKEIDSDKKANISNLQSYFKAPEYSKEILMKNYTQKQFDMTLDMEFKRKIGLAVHFYLEQIKYGEISEKEYARKLTLGRYGNMLGQEKLKEVFQRGDELIERKSEFFQKRWDVFTEYSIKEDDKEYRIDRLLIDKKLKEICILDFKTGFTKEQSQLDKYKELIQKRVEDNYKIKVEFLNL
ncbi:MAG: UvrD-helicase domain-containing protein [Fusobacteriota bacterium]